MFDKVPKKGLLTKLRLCGANGNLHKWLEDWISLGKQRVVINGKAFIWRGVLCGVPQGSVLGPVLFLMCVNDCDDDITCKISKFADDTKITSRVISSVDTRELQLNLDRLVMWTEK